MTKSPRIHVRPKDLTLKEISERMIWTDAPQAYLRDETAFIKQAFRAAEFRQKGLGNILKKSDPATAWEALLTYYAKRKDFVDPVLQTWQSSTSLDLKKALRSVRENLAPWRKKSGKVDWTYGNRPPRTRWEEFWCRNRLDPIMQWARAAVISKHKTFRLAVARCFLEWFDDNPVPELPHKKWWDQPTHGFNWREIEVGIRARKLVTLFLASCSWRDVPQRYLRSLLCSIKQHQDYLTSYTAQLGYIHGNHHCHHAQGPLAASLLLPEFKDATSWKKFGMTIFHEHWFTDHDPDGLQNEYSPGYHLGMLGQYVDAYQIIRLNGHKPAAWMKRAMDKMAQYVLYISDATGWVFPINDARQHNSLLTLRRLAKTLNRPELLALEKQTPKTKALPLSRGYRHGGLAVMRSSWKSDATVVALDATGHNSGHWHPGKPNLLLHAGSEQLACEHMFGSYDDPSFCSYFHTARAHNTILIDGEGENTPRTPWTYRYQTEPRLTHFKNSEAYDVAIAETDGFKRFPSPVSFERTVVFLKPHLIWVHDALETSGKHRYEWLLHLLPQVPELDREHGSLTTTLGGPFELHCQPVPGHRTKVAGPFLKQGKHANKTDRLQKTVGPFWDRPAKGKKPALLTTAPYGVWRQQTVGPAVFDFLLQVVPKGEALARVEHVVDGEGFLIRKGRKKFQITFQDGGPVKSRVRVQGPKSKRKN